MDDVRLWDYDIRKVVWKVAKNEKTSKRVASKAGKLLSTSKTKKNMKSVAASALTQAPDKKPKKKSS